MFLPDNASPTAVLPTFSDIITNLLGQEGYMKTDDRMRLAKERREERERSLGRLMSCFYFCSKLSLLSLLVI